MQVMCIFYKIKSAAILLIIKVYVVCASNYETAGKSAVYVCRRDRMLKYKWISLTGC